VRLEGGSGISGQGQFLTRIFGVISSGIGYRDVFVAQEVVRAADLSREMINLRFVITGGPGAGKTTILHALAARGYMCAAESARAIIRERLASGLSPRPPLAQFGNEILQRDIARYRETRATAHPVFFDRGIVDALGILDQQHAISLGEVEEYIRSFPYNKMVLLMPPWEAIYRTDAERDQTFAASVQVWESLRTWYARWDYQTIEVPRTAIDQRVNFILQTVEYALTSRCT
jgi:predicted ATPase